jgi:AcrR family transcriptional regulator
VARSAATGIDGRLARGERARAAVADALLALVEEGDLQPTAPRIAERAGVSLRLVFHHFRDLEDLFAVTAERQIARIFPLLRPVSAAGPLAPRLAAFVAERSRLLEMIAPVRRAALLRAPFSTEVSARLAMSRKLKRDELERVFATELSSLPPAERAEVSVALAVAGSFSAWEELRKNQGLTVEQARAVTTRTMRALLSRPKK